MIVKHPRMIIYWPKYFIHYRYIGDISNGPDEIKTTFITPFGLPPREPATMRGGIGADKLVSAHLTWKWK